MSHKRGRQAGDAPSHLRADARRNRDRILDVALVELTGSADVPLSTIAKKAGVGQATFYRNFPNRESLVLEVYRHEVQQVHEAAIHLLAAHPPDEALREWMDRLAQYAATKAGLAEALRATSSAAPGAAPGPARWGHGQVTAAIALLLDANETAGTIRPGVTPDDFLLAIAGLWQLGGHEDRRTRSTRLMDLIMDGLRTGAPRPGRGRGS